MMAPRPVTAKDVRLLNLLAQELAVAQNRYYWRTVHGDAAYALKRAKVEARLTYRRFWTAITGWPARLA